MFLADGIRGTEGEQFCCKCVENQPYSPAGIDFPVSNQPNRKGEWLEPWRCLLHLRFGFCNPARHDTNPDALLRQFPMHQMAGAGGNEVPGAEIDAVALEAGDILVVVVEPDKCSARQRCGVMKRAMPVKICLLYTSPSPRD